MVLDKLTKIKLAEKKLTPILQKEQSIMLNKRMIHYFGLNESVLLCSLLNKYQYFKTQNTLKNGEFWNTHKNIWIDTTLSKYQQNKAFDKLEELGIVCKRFNNENQKLYFFINYCILYDIYKKLMQDPSEKFYPKSKINYDQKTEGGKKLTEGGKKLTEGGKKLDPIIYIKNINKNINNSFLSKERNRRKCTDDLLERIDDENKLKTKGKIKIKRQEPYPFTKNPDVKEIFTYWNQLGKPLPKHKINTTKTFIKTCKQIEQTLSTNPKEKIITAIATYYNMVCSSWFKLNHSASGVIVGLMDFLSVSAGLHARIYQHNPELKIRSWFLECRNADLSTLQEKYSKLIVDKYPIITKALKKHWLDIIDNKKIFTIEEENILCKTAKLLYDYSMNIKDFKSDHNHKKQYPATLAVFVINAFVGNNKTFDKVPYWLASKVFMEDTVGNYLVKIGYVEKGHDKYVAAKKQHNLQNNFVPVEETGENALSIDDFF